MIFAEVIAVILVLGLIIGDWFQFTTLKSWACQYGFRLAQRRDRLHPGPFPIFAQLFESGQSLQLPHGLARWVEDQQVVVIRPTYKLFSLRFRTAWPLKGSIHVRQSSDQLVLHMSKRIPWSSALMTMVWLVFVIGGTLTFTVVYALDGGFATLGGFFWGMGMIALGILVVAGGIILLSFAYRLEDSRLMQVYEEWLEALGTTADGENKQEKTPVS